LKDVVSSQLDADRLDYLQRDVMATGVRHGRFDLQRMLLFLLPGPRRMHVDARAMTAVEGYVIARAHMYEQVYYHKTVRAAETMLRAAVFRARDLDAVEGLRPGMRATLEGELPALADYLDLDDGDFFAALRTWSTHEDEGLARLAGGLLHRRLMKCVAVPDAVAFGKGYDGLQDRARALVKRRGFDPDADLLLDDTAEERYLPYVIREDRKETILMLPAGRKRPVPLEDQSDLVRRLAERRVFLVRWFCRPELVEPLRRLVARAAK
jgi:HD superfamily phosphohydrolase